MSNVNPAAFDPFVPINSSDRQISMVLGMETISKSVFRR